MKAQIHHQHHQDGGDHTSNDHYLVNYHDCTFMRLEYLLSSSFVFLDDCDFQISLTEVLHVLFTSGQLRWELPPEINCFVSNNFGKAQMQESCNLANHTLRWRRQQMVRRDKSFIIINITSRHQTADHNHHHHHDHHHHDQQADKPRQGGCQSNS